MTAKNWHVVARTIITATKVTIARLEAAELFVRNKSNVVSGYTNCAVQIERLFRKMSIESSF